MFQYILPISLFFLGAEAVCPSTPNTVWVQLGNQCYHISQRKMSSMKGGQEYCWGIGGNLAEIMSEEEETFLDSFLLEGISYWTGLSDEGHEGIVFLTHVPPMLIMFVFLGIYRWEENHQEAIYTNWAFNEPTNTLEENCVRKTYRVGYVGWHDVNCDQTWEEGFGEMHALCQTPPTSKF